MLQCLSTWKKFLETYQVSLLNCVKIGSQGLGNFSKISKIQFYWNIVEKIGKIRRIQFEVCVLEIALQDSIKMNVTSIIRNTIQIGWA